MRLFLTCLIICSISLDAAANLNSWVRLNYYSSTRFLDERNNAGSFTAGAKYFRQINSVQKIRLEGYGLVDLRDDDSFFRLRDAYWQFRGGRLDWRLGQQLITWGKADGINPTDYFTASDFTHLPLESDHRLSVPAIKADLNIYRNKSLEFVLSPHFNADMLPSPRELALENRKPDGWRRPQLGLRWKSTGKIDWSVNAFRGYFTTPILGVENNVLLHQYEKLNAIGFDVAGNIGRWGLRGELAWLDLSNEFQSYIRSHVFMVTGVDRGTGNWNINLQWIARYTPDFNNQTDSNPLEQFAQHQNRIVFGQKNNQQHGFSGRISSNWSHNTLQAELLIVHYLDPSNTLFRPLLRYEVNDSAHISLGGEYYAGSRDSFFGQLKPNRMVLLEYGHSL